MTGLAARLARRIAAAGPITVAEYMAAALGDAEHGYYRNAAALGREGDFITAPEISQVFGELIGVWLADCWEKLGRPDPVMLVELGPGRGTLMADALRATRRIPGWHEALALHLVEINPRLRQAQAGTLAAFHPAWHDSAAALPEGPTLVVANEFFDALPIRQFVCSRGAWRERLVDWNAEGGFHFVLARAPSPLAALLAGPPGPDEAVIELSPAAMGLVGELARRIARDRGAALLIDYGHAGAVRGDSLQAVSRHRPAAVLGEPGLADLSAHVDFGLLSRAAREGGAMVYGPTAQGEFLDRLGLRIRIAQLKSRASADQARALDAAAERLAGSAAMGALFKVLALATPGVNPAGFGTGAEKSG